MSFAMLLLLVFSIAAVVNARRVKMEKSSQAKDDRPAVCMLSGDPHITTFDSYLHGGGQWHPMHAPGHWWLVRTRNDAVSIQATYGGCGLKDQGGWMSTKLGGVPRTCATGIAIGGRFIRSSRGDPGKLVIKPPCAWDFETSSCTTTDTTPRVMWNDRKVESVSSTDPPISVTYPKENEIKVKLPLDIEIHIWMGGRWNGVPYTFFNVHIKSPPPPVPVCGHCGNFNGQSGDDKLYKQTGELIVPLEKGADSMCDAAVHCGDRLITDVQFGSYAEKDHCTENEKGVEFNLEDCPPKELEDARRSCAKEFGKTHLTDKHLEDLAITDCLLDECLSQGFAGDDAREAEQEDRDKQYFGKEP